MPLRLRLAASISVLIAALVLSLLGVIPSGASVKTGGKVVSAHLSSTSFTAVQAKKVKLVCKFSPASSRFAYVLSKKNGAKWAKVRSVNKKGSFKGSYSMTVKELFGSKPVKVGQYRVEVSADANSVTRKFRVVKTTTVVRPIAGFWLGSTSGATSYVITFDVTSGGTSVTGFMLTFDIPSCGSAGYGTTAKATSPSPIASGAFSASGSYYFSGTFDSATSAHGTVGLNRFLTSGCGNVDLGPASWTATWHRAS